MTWIKRRLDAGKLEAGEYRLIVAPMCGTTRRELACPRCATVALLEHRIAPNGNVIGRWACTSEACPAMEWLRLDGVE